MSRVHVLMDAHVLRLELADLELECHQAAQGAVEEQQIDGVFPAGNANEREATSHLPQEGLDLRQDRDFELALAVLVAELQEVEGAPSGSSTSSLMPLAPAAADPADHRVVCWARSTRTPSSMNNPVKKPPELVYCVTSPPTLFRPLFAPGCVAPLQKTTSIPASVRLARNKNDPEPMPQSV